MPYPQSEMSPPVLARPSVVDELERRLLADILSGRFPVGDRLPTERDLATTYDVARATVKQTLVRLEVRGLIRTRHGVGSTVTDYVDSAGLDVLPLLASAAATSDAATSDAVDGSALLAEVFVARRAIGAAIAAGAATRADADALADVAAAIDAVAAAPGALAAVEAEAEVHRRLAHASGNRVWVLLTNTFLEVYAGWHAGVAAAFDDAAPFVRGLRRLHAALVSGDADAAASAAQRYLDRSAVAFAAALRARRQDAR